jgi:hypothetical protein
MVSGAQPADFEWLAVVGMVSLRNPVAITKMFVLTPTASHLPGSNCVPKDAPGIHFELNRRISPAYLYKLVFTSGNIGRPAFLSFVNAAALRFISLLVRQTRDKFTDWAFAPRLFLSLRLWFADVVFVAVPLAIPTLSAKPVLVSFASIERAFRKRLMTFSASFHSITLKGASRSASQYCCHAIQAKREAFDANKNTDQLHCVTSAIISQAEM